MTEAMARVLVDALDMAAVVADDLSTCGTVEERHAARVTLAEFESTALYLRDKFGMEL